MRDGFTSEAEAGVATERLACVTRELMVVSVQRRERADRRATRVTRELWCEMNAVTLERLAETDGVDAAVAAAARAELGDGERLEGDVLRTLRAYTFSPQGRD